MKLIEASAHEAIAIVSPWHEIIKITPDFTAKLERGGRGWGSFKESKWDFSCILLLNASMFNFHFRWIQWRSFPKYPKNQINKPALSSNNRRILITDKQSEGPLIV